VLSYRAALDIRDDPVVAGRLGLVALEGGATAEAVGLLLRAIIDGQDAKPVERDQFHEAYKRARGLVCRLDFTLSHLGAEVLLDGEIEPWAATKSDFYIFVMPGRHEVRATLTGHKGTGATIEAFKGGRVAVPITFEPLQEKPESVPTPSPEPSPKPAPTSATETPAPIQATQATPTDAPLKRDDSTIKTFSPWSFGAGPVVVVGAVSPLPAVGVVGSIDLKIGEVASFRLDARGASSPYMMNGWPIRGWTIGILPSVCAKRSLYFLCGQVHFGAIGHDTNSFSPPPYSILKIRGGIGSSFGIEPQIKGAWHLRIAADVLFFLDETPVGTGGTSLERAPIWTGPIVLGGLSVLVVWRHGTL
jgi:hypothetical protein